MSATIEVVINLYNSLVTYPECKRDMFNLYEEKAMNLCGEDTYNYDSTRKRRRKLQHGEQRENFAFSGRDNYRMNVFYVIIDRLCKELKRRCNAYEGLFANFDFLIKLCELDTKQIFERAQTLRATYSDDIEDEFDNECIHLHCYMTEDNLDKEMSLLCLYKNIP